MKFGALYSSFSFQCSWCQVFDLGRGNISECLFFSFLRRLSITFSLILFSVLFLPFFTSPDRTFFPWSLKLSRPLASHFTGLLLITMRSKHFCSPRFFFLFFRPFTSRRCYLISYSVREHDGSSLFTRGSGPPEGCCAPVFTIPLFNYPGGRQGPFPKVLCYFLTSCLDILTCPVFSYRALSA